MPRLGEIVNNILEPLNLKMEYNIFPRNFDPVFSQIYKKCKNYTMTSEEKMYSLYCAAKYVIDAKIKGDFVECGVWKGGSSMAAAYAFMHMKNTKKKLYLYDTYTGMSEPTSNDTTIFSKENTHEKWRRFQKKEGTNKWCLAPLEEVKENMYSTGYPENKIVFVKGKVEQTMPKILPRKISVLRLDTDWYESTYHELKHLFPRLSKNGVLIIDDYGHWKGSQKAVDKYFKEHKIKMLLNNVDYSGRIGIKI